MQNQLSLEELLKGMGQDHILQAYDKADPAKKQQLHSQILLLDKNYPGGLRKYHEKARRLVKDSANSVNPYQDYQVSVPDGIKLQFRKENLDTVAHYENMGLKQFEHTAFVLVAGGLGERLGYPGIKISIPFQLLTREPFIKYYVDYILAFQSKYCSPGTKIPLLIMTSGDTHDQTVALLQQHDYFGMDKNQQLILVKQEKVPAIVDNQARFSLIDSADRLEIETKPHGHGDIHTLLYLQGVVQKWVDAGKKWIIFFQDTNPLSFRSFPSLLGVTVEKNFEFNSLTVDRKPGQAVGAIARLVHKDSQKTLVVNVEYNQLKGLFEEAGGEKVDENGYSVYPGNINSFVISAERYNETLAKTKGEISQFINPKYADETKTKFKSAARLECLMQDYPKLLENCDRVGYISLDKGFCFTTLKNDPKTAITRYNDGLSSESAGTCEAEFYFYNREMLRMCGADIEEDDKQQFGGIALPLFPMVSLSPKFATCITELRTKVKKLKMSKKSSLVVADECVLENVQIDGHCEIKDKHGSPVSLKVADKNYKKIVDLKQGQENPPYLTIRGYDME